MKKTVKIISSALLLISVLSFTGCDIIQNILKNRSSLQEKLLASQEDPNEENPQSSDPSESTETSSDDFNEDLTETDYPDKTLVLSGRVSESQIKKIKADINKGKIQTLDMTKSFFDDGVIFQNMFYNCKNLKKVILPTSITAIEKNAFSGTGISEIIFPANITLIGEQAFADCSSLEQVTFYCGMNIFAQGAFKNSPVKNVYAIPIVPPTIKSNAFTSNPTIYVYQEALSTYKSSEWAGFGTIASGMDKIFPDDILYQRPDTSPIHNYFEDAACTILKQKYESMSDSSLTSAMKNDGLPQILINMALKIKNNSWAPYEKEFRIQEYSAFSDPAKWNSKLMALGLSYQSNPTGIYTTDDSPIYVFVDNDPPYNYFEDDPDKTPFLSELNLGRGNDKYPISGLPGGTELSKGMNIIDGRKDHHYYIAYMARTEDKTRKVQEWPKIKIHIEGGKVNGYYDAARHNDADYKALLANASSEWFDVKGEASVFHFKTQTYKNRFPDSIQDSIKWFDSVAIREMELMGLCSSVESGQRAGSPFYLTGGEALYPDYFNNSIFATQGDSSDSGYANSSRFRTSYNSEDCISASFDVSRPDHDDWCVSHEVGHHNQNAIMLDNTSESSNNLFSNFIRFTDGTTTSTGKEVSYTINDYTKNLAFSNRSIDSTMRMYYQLYLYYHQAQHNTSFYPELFKELRSDKLVLWKNGNSSTLKFVRKVCEIADEDLTEFFTLWGFFEPVSLTNKDKKTLVVTQQEIDECLADISKYPKKNRGIIFIEDRIEKVPTTDFMPASIPGQVRRVPGEDGQWGDLGQFTDFIEGKTTRANYTCSRSGSTYTMKGSGGVGFLIYDSNGTNGKLLFASNKKQFTMPENISTSNIKIYSVDADGTLKEVK